MITIKILRVKLVGKNYAKVTFTSPERKAKTISKYTVEVFLNKVPGVAGLDEAFFRLEIPQHLWDRSLISSILCKAAKDAMDDPDQTRRLQAELEKQQARRQEADKKKAWEQLTGSLSVLFKLGVSPDKIENVVKESLAKSVMEV